MWVHLHYSLHWMTCWEVTTLILQSFNTILGTGVQHREVQEHESHSFLSYFSNSTAGGIQYMKGTESDINASKDAKISRLFHIKGKIHDLHYEMNEILLSKEWTGKKLVKVSQVTVSHASLNSGDVFVMDRGNKIFQWNGKESSRIERSKAMQFCQNVKNGERKGLAQCIILGTYAHSKCLPLLEWFNSWNPLSSVDLMI